MWRFVIPLLWKSWCIRKRHYIATLLELLVPIGLTVLLLYAKSGLPNSNGETIPNTTFVPKTKEDIIQYPHLQNNYKLEIVYAPDTDENVNNTIMNQLQRSLQDYNYNVVLIPAANESEVTRILYDKYDGVKIFGEMIYGLIFTKDLSYTLRPISSSFQTDYLFPVFSSPGPGEEFITYLREGFLLLQILINDAICQLKNPNVGAPNFQMTEFPYPSYERVDKFKLIFSILIPMIFLFGYYSFVPNLISNAIQEKNSGAREWMGMVGIPKTVVLLSWVLYAMPLYLITNIVCCVILVSDIVDSSLLNPANVFFVWLVLFLFCTCTVVFLLAATSFINNPTVAVIFGSFVWILPSIAASNYASAKDINYPIKIITCFFPSCALNWAFTAISSYEANREVITFSNLFSTKGGLNDISLGLTIIFLFGTIFLYCLIFLYIDSVKPGNYGRARSWYFPFSVIYNKFCGENKGDDRPILNKKTNNFEEVSNLSVGLSIQSIKKKFGNVIAVEDVTMDVYKGQITALLGHNGAGKTTLLNIITGMFHPTQGKIWQDGKNVFDDFSSFQKNLGLCPQHDLLFPYLNVLEHVTFFGMLRGLSRSQALADSKDLLKFFGISDKASSLTKKLSGGMKRKLSLSISLIGNPEILILDEPTSGMDPESRRETWNKLLALRGNRSIILTTHYMEEADVLGDMIAIMDHGIIKCYGTSLFLKKQYGSGYKVSVPLDDKEIVTDIMKSYIPEVPLPSITDSHISFTLPLKKSSVFSNLFSELENRLPESTRISVGCTTLDDVFLKVANNSSDEVDNMMADEEVLLNDSTKGDDIHSSREALTPKPLTGFPLFYGRLSALFMKKLLYNFHRWASWFFLTIFYPFIIFTVPLSLTSAILKGEPTNNALAMNLSIYGDTEVIISPMGISSNKSISNAFTNLVISVGSNAILMKNSTSIEEALLNMGTENLSKYRYSYVIAANMTTNVVNLFYSSIATHSPPIAVNMFYKAWMIAFFADDKFGTTIHPFSFQIDECSPSVLQFISFLPPLIWLFTAPLVLAIIPFSFSRLHHDERLNSGKLLQLMTGTSPMLYWFSAYLCDLFLFLVSSSLILLWVYIFDTAHLFTESKDYGIFLFIILISCTGNAWFGYVTSYFLRTFSRLFSVNMFIAFLVGQVSYLFVSIFMWMVDESNSFATANIFHHILMFYPPYCSSALVFKFIKHLTIHSFLVKCSTGIGHVVEEKPLFSWSDDGINQELVYISCDCLIFASLIFLTDYGVFSKMVNFIFNLYVGPFDQSNTSFDTDVENEKNKVEEALHNAHASQSYIIVDSLGKKYSRNVTAVKSINFLIPKGECFGLLGVNGAGKSTTFKMLTGDLLPSVGQAVLFGDSLRNNRFKYQSHIGYCPQTDAIIDALSGTEMLKLYASLRGVNPSGLQKAVSFWTTEFGLEGVCNRKCETYSGGNKRKLSTAISLIGDPQVVFLDEPTTGVDPVARRKFWDILSKLQKRGCTIILTSHSMDECETVCNRLTIMVKGEMKCIGNIQRLKEMYGQGFTVIIQLGPHSETELNSLKSAFSEQFSPHAILRDEHIGLLHYHINCPDYKWSSLFSTLETLKETNSIIKDYAVSETTLEQIFLHFAKV